MTTTDVETTGAAVAPAWVPRTVESAAGLDLVPPPLPPGEAQAWCNFVVFTPTALPVGWVLEPGTIRREAPPGRVDGVEAGRTPWSSNNPSAYRFEVTAGGRRLRVKEFLYDWAFPALDHPCLWNSPTRAVPVDDTTVAWFGTDYLGHRAASVRAARTTIEISVLDGEFTDDELLALVRSLQPVSAEAALALSATPFADLSYWARYDASMVDVPVGLWRFRRPDRPHEGAWTAEPAGVARLLSSLPLPAALGSLAPDSAAVFENQAGRSEIEVVYAGGPGRGCELRLIAQGAAQGRLVVPSERESHPCTTGRLTLEDVEVQLAWIDARYGPFDAVWADPVAGLELKLLSTTGVGLSRAWFLSAVREAIVACRARGAG